MLDRIWWAIQAAQPWKEYDLGRLNPVQLEKMESKLMELREDTVVEQPRTVQFVDKPKLRPLIARAFEEMGIRGEPIGAEKVQEIIAACGVRPEDNIFSQGIIEMREE